VHGARRALRDAILVEEGMLGAGHQPLEQVAAGDHQLSLDTRGLGAPQRERADQRTVEIDRIVRRGRIGCRFECASSANATPPSGRTCAAAPGRGTK
jgi:hypothetical protein